MKPKYPKTLLPRPLKALLVPTLFGLSLGGLSLGTGCAHQPSEQPNVQAQQQEALVRLQSRLQEVERTNGRLNVRIEELEDQIFLLQDMTESNRIALRRRGYMQRGGYLNQPDARAQAPQPTPESYYGSESPYGGQQPNSNYRQPQRRNVTRIPLSREQSGAAAADNSQDQQQAPDQQRSDQQPPAQEAPASDSGEELVITDEQFRAFVGDSPRKSKSSDSSGSTRRKAQAPVTDEKLRTSDADDSGAADTNRGDDEPSSANVDNPLDLYKTALSDYRGGDYAQALSGFRAFLNSGPNSNYLDNALYWIGECHYGLGDYQKAVNYFQRVLGEQPDGNKVPDAMLKMSLAFERLGEPGKASAMLEKLTNRYPTTNAGRLGAQKLSEEEN